MHGVKYLAETFDVKQFVLSWKNMPALMGVFWFVFAGFFISGILKDNFILEIIGTLIIFLISWRYIINEIMYTALSSLNFKPNKIGLVDAVVLALAYIIGIILPWWAGVYFIAQILVMVAILVLMSQIIMGIGIFMGIGSTLLFGLILIYIIMLIYNSLRLYLVTPLYLIKKDADFALKESWKLTDKNVIKIFVYTLKVLWYTITNTWLFILAAILAFALLYLGGFYIYLSFGGSGVILFGIIMGLIIRLLLTYSQTVMTYINSFMSAAVYSLLSKKE